MGQRARGTRDTHDYTGISTMCRFVSSEGGRYKCEVKIRSLLQWIKWRTFITGHRFFYLSGTKTDTVESTMITHSNYILFALQIRCCQTPQRHPIFFTCLICFFSCDLENVFTKFTRWRGIPPVRGGSVTVNKDSLTPVPSTLWAARPQL